MTERHLAELSEAGVSIWLDDLSRERLETGNLADLVDDHHVVGRHHQPDDLRRRAHRAPSATTPRSSDLAVARRRRRRGASARSPPPTSATPATCCGRPTTRTDGVDGRVSIEVAPGSPTTPTRPSPRPRSCGRWSTGRTCSSRSRRPEGPAGDHASAGRGHQRQRHADLRPRPLPRRHGRLPRRPRAGARRTATTFDDPLGRLVLRLPGRHRDRQAARQDRRRRGQGAARARPASPTRGWPTRPTRRSSPATAGRRSQAAGANLQRPLWASTGVKDPDYQRHDVRRSTSSPPTPSTRCPRRPCKAVPTTAQSGRHRAADTTSTPRAVIDGSRDVGIDYDDVVPTSRGRGRREVRASWDELIEAVQKKLEKPEADADGESPSHRARRHRPSPAARGRGRRAPRRPIDAGVPKPGQQGRHAVGAGRRDRGRRSGWAGSTCRELAAAARRDRELRAELAADGIDHVVLAGMGGSSLAPEVIARTPASR